MILENVEPKAVMAFFEQLCAIPHGSGNTKKISDFCCAFAEARGLEHTQDALNNVVILGPASPGYESAAPVILQGHLDMVCEKAPDSPIDFMTDGLDLATDGKTVWARGTTLGGDDGIAVAMILALLDSTSLPHPRLEAVFTVDEETGMFGARALDASRLTGRRMLNLDSEDEGVFTVGCAGGARANCLLPVSRRDACLMPVELTVGGLIGGHSGQQIDKGRGNSNILMGRVLRALADRCPVQLVSLAGGKMDNAIPLETTAAAGLAPEDADILISVAEEMDAAFKNEFRASDAGVFVSAKMQPVTSVRALPAEDSERVIDALTLFPNGIQAMSMEIPGLVRTSLNLGILKLEDDHLRASFSLRSSVATEKEMLKGKLRRLMAVLGGTAEFTGEYPAWEYRPDSPLRAAAAQAYEELTGRKPRVIAIHAGLECGLFSEKLPGLDCVSFGPDMHDIHTCRETLDAASVARTWTLLLEILKRLR